MIDYREKYRKLHSFHCNWKGDPDEDHECVFKFIEELLDEIDRLNEDIYDRVVNE